MTQCPNGLLSIVVLDKVVSLPPSTDRCRRTLACVITSTSCLRTPSSCLSSAKWGEGILDQPSHHITLHERVVIHHRSLQRSSNFRRLVQRVVKPPPRRFRIFNGPT